MAARKIRGRWWVDFRHEFTRYRKKSPVDTRAGALEYEALLRRRLVRGEPLVAKPTAVVRPETFREFAGRWFTTYVVPNNKPSEQRSKEISLRLHLLPEFGKLSLDEITPERIEAFKARKQREGLAPKTVNNLLATLGRSLTIAEEWGVVSRRPRIRLLRVPPQPFRYLPAEQGSVLLAAIDEPLWHDLVLTAMRTGLRLGELRALGWNDVDLARTTIHVNRSYVRGQYESPKSNKVRRVPISQELKACLARRKQRTAGPLVFTAPGQDHPLGEHRMRLALARYCKRAGVPRVSWHDLRHSFASQLVASGASIRAVQELLGHSDLRVTLRYSHLNEQHLADAVLRLDAPPAPRHESPLATGGVLLLGQPVGNALPPETPKQHERPREYATFPGRGGGTRTRENKSGELGEDQRNSTEVGQDQDAGAVAS